MTIEIAPVALFAFRRPDHLRRTLTALAANHLAARSDLIAFADGPRQQTDLPFTNMVRDILKEWAGNKAFRSFRIEAQNCNHGLAKSIIDGVTRITQEYGRVIVMEDDLVTSPAFLDFMNEGLNIHANNERVASIHGYCYPVDNMLPPAFFLRGADCWGWATWSRAWRHFEPDGATLMCRLYERKLTRAFDLDGSRDLIGMLEHQVAGRNESWAIRWHASAFLANLLTLYPGRSLVHNIGNDDSGTHCAKQDIFDAVLNQSNPPVDIPVVESDEARRIIASWFRSHTQLRDRIGMIANRLRRRLFGRDP